MAYIEFHHIQKYFGDNHVLKDISFGVEQGQLITLLGASGCGKSTLLRCLAGLEQVSDGEIFLDGKNITDLSPQKREIGMVFQQYSLFPNMTIEQNVAFGLKIKKVPAAQIKTEVKEVLELVGLSDRATFYPNQLSGGQQQRVALARAIVLKPKILLLDEPLSAIDALLRRNLQIEIRRIQQELGITTIFVTHDQDEAMIMSDCIYLFNAGQVEQFGTPAELYAHPRTHFAANFIGHYNILPAEQFGRLVGEKMDAVSVAIRPELIQVSNTPIEGDGYHLRAKLERNELHGNVLRVQLSCGELSLQADMLFQRDSIYLEGTDVYILIPRKSCLMLED